MKKILILATGLFFSCENSDVSKEAKLTDTSIIQRQSSLYQDVESTFIENGLNTTCENNILIFPDWETYYLTIDKLDDAVDNHCDAFEKNANPNLTDEEYEKYGEDIGFDEDQPLRDFERDLSFCSLWHKIYDNESAWLAQQSDEEWNIDEDPDNHFIDEETERILLNTANEVMIGTKEKGYIVYKFFEWGYIEVHNNDMNALSQINMTGEIPKNNENIIVFNEIIEIQEATDCKGNRTFRKYFRTGSKTRIKAVDKIVNFRGAPGPSKSSKIKSKTKYYRKKLGVWTRGKTTITAGFEGSYNRLSYFDDWRECGTSNQIAELKTRKRSKVKKKHKGPYDMYFRVFDDQLFGVHKRRNDVIKKVDYFNGNVN